MPVRPLPPDPSLDHLKHQARDLQRDHAARDRAAAQRIREFHPRYRRASDDEIFAAELKLADAQLTIARERGFASWPRLKAHVDKPERLDVPAHERIRDAEFRRAVDLLDAGDVAGLRAHLAAHPDVVRQRVELAGGNYFTHPTLLEFIAENPTRRGTLPANIVDVARVIIDAGAESLDDALDLVASSLAARTAGVQAALIDLLCDRGADPQKVLRTAVVQGEHGAAQQLLARGAVIDVVVAAALGRTADVVRLVAAASADDRLLALGEAAQYGHLDVVRALLVAGVDPSHYIPVGGHSHTTPLHQAALAGHAEVARLLVSRGASRELRDIMHGATPAGWAEYAGHDALAAELAP
ncbi:MAG: ankyrin repeat domain-containing protein [Deltaproteobacteria bacterium]|nr:ankyrin repeat domain-containing protein [Deltaproteobacteria bacterium]